MWCNRRGGAEPIASPPMAERLVVIGGDAAGMTAATNARRTAIRPRDRRLRAGPPHELLGLRHPVSGRRRGRRRLDDAGRPHARRAPRDQPHRRAHRPRGDGHRPRPPRRSRCTTSATTAPSASASTTCSSAPAPDRSARPARASTASRCAACRPSTTASTCWPSPSRAGASAWSSSAAATSGSRWPRPSSCGAPTSPSSTPAPT